MKPLTIDELKALQVGDWVWVIDEDFKNGRYREITFQNELEPTLFYVSSYSNPAKVYNFTDYGTKWLAYKNKEFAESKGEYLELSCIEPFSSCNIETGEPCTCYNILYRDKASGELAIDCEVDKSEAERRLAELRGEK